MEKLIAKGSCMVFDCDKYRIGIDEENDLEIVIHDNDDEMSVFIPEEKAKEIATKILETLNK